VDAHVGRVTAFDTKRGLGTVKDLDTGTEYPFHATAIADGSRTIPEGIAAVFTTTPGHGGRYEAGWLRPLDTESSHQRPA
jgi:cold shock CspA family protein